jgi:hypothetical protein
LQIVYSNKRPSKEKTNRSSLKTHLTTNATFAITNLPSQDEVVYTIDARMKKRELSCTLWPSGMWNDAPKLNLLVYECNPHVRTVSIFFSNFLLIPANFNYS